MITPEKGACSNFFSNRKRKSKRFKRIGDGLFRYQKSGVIYGVFKVQSQTVWKNLNTADREHAKLRLAEEVRKNQKINLKASHKTTLNQLLDYYDKNLENFAPGTSENRRCLIKTFRNSWQYGLGMKVSEIRSMHLRTWLALHRQRLKSHTWNAYLRFLRAVFHLATEAQIIAENPAVEPGYKSPVTQADVDEVMAKIRPVESRPRTKLADSIKIKYFVLVRVIKLSRVQEPFAMPEDTTKHMLEKMMAEMEKQLVEEKLLQPVPNARPASVRFEATELGRRFVSDYERDHPPKL